MNLKGIVRFLALSFFFLVAAKAEAQVGFPYCESFQTASTQANTIFGGDAKLVDGVLQLTTNGLNQTGYMYIDVPFPSVYGIKVEFEYFMYGGSGADGLSMFLFDAATPNFAPGGFGGSLGYAQRNEQPGLTGAYLGLGFDAFGNFSNTTEGKNGGFLQGFSALFPNSITLRKGGSGFSGYDYVIGRMTQDPPAGANDLALDVQYRFPLSSGGQGTQRVEESSKVGYRKVFLELEPHPAGTGYLVKLEMEVTTEDEKPRLVTIFPDISFPFPAPSNLKIGFAGSTGGSSNFHEIRNLVVEVSADDALQDPEGSDIVDFTSCAGQENQFYITSDEVLLPNTNSVIRCLQLYETRDDIEAKQDDICSQARCLEQNRVLILPEGTFRATDQEGGFTFFPNEEYAGKEVTIFYTVTDSYGKSSQGNSISVKIEESPEPIRLSVLGYGEVVDLVEICPGESVTLEGIGEEVYDRYEWYKDGEIVQGELGASLSTGEEGEYEILAYNRKNCPVASNSLRVDLPDLPVLDIDSPIVGCTPGQVVDLASQISGYDISSYDYRLSGMGLMLINDQLKSVSIAGAYELSIKRKSLECYSDPLPIEVFIQEEELEVDFDFGVKGTGVKDESGGGVFPDDEIQFVNLADDRAVAWEWDFGDGTISEDQNPVHVFGKKGEFDVELLVTDQYGCQNSVKKTVAITRSYRLMVPTGFTPTEPENKKFLPKYKGLVKFELLVFNTWGELIFRTEDLDTEGWDGTLEGKLLDAGVFAYRINGVATDGEQVRESGKFRLIR
ncbi:PKD domain-containing protein [Algoriphagus aestuariicola]|uniref:PKD domain-containing protein n=1 Tax=Algoriphagus aestuariicola TaxID=1852016 RepID=A0ABS3BYM4_9BACT|nr:PKD domain-containing protein [Algoriphagus aestuariicola]MBN7803406.1 PKD domain-containing protein [Algoriphagus aestuariicola]